MASELIQKLENFEDIGALLPRDLVEFGGKKENNPYRGTWMFMEKVPTIRGAGGAIFIRKIEEGVIECATVWADEVEVRYGKIRPAPSGEYNGIVQVCARNDFDAYEKLNNFWEGIA